MNISDFNKLMAAFERLVAHMNRNGLDETIKSVTDNYNSLIVTMMGHNGEEYDLETYFNGKTGLLEVENATNHSSMFDFAEEFFMSKADVEFIRKGDVEMEEREKVKKNIALIKAWLCENRDPVQSVIVHWSPRKGEWGKIDFREMLRVSTDGSVEVGNAWGYHTVWRPIDNMLLDCDEREFVLEWKEIKQRFIDAKAAQIAKRNSESDAIFNFEV